MNGNSNERLEYEKRNALHRWILVAILCASLSVFVSYFLFDRGGYLDCDLLSAPSVSVRAEISFRVVNQYNSRTYSVDVISSDPRISGPVSCYAGSVCGWLMKFEGWPKASRMVLRQCGLRNNIPQYYISDIEIEGRAYPFPEIYGVQIRVMKYGVATLCVTITSLLLALLRIRGLVNRNQFGEGV